VAVIAAGDQQVEEPSGRRSTRRRARRHRHAGIDLKPPTLICLAQSSEWIRSWLGTRGKGVGAKREGRRTLVGFGSRIGPPCLPAVPRLAGPFRNFRGGITKFAVQ
jgi:hypothetical protein